MINFQLDGNQIPDGMYLFGSNGLHLLESVILTYATSSIPKICSGHGRCLTIKEMGQEFNGL